MGSDLYDKLCSPGQTRRFEALYGMGTAGEQAERYARLAGSFATRFGENELRFFSAPGRTEIGGNHTDHNHGQVLAAAITLDTIAAVAKTDDGVITLCSEGYDQLFRVDTADLEKKGEEHETQALIRGVAVRMRELGYVIGGFNAQATSTVLGGSGLSSSAAFEILILTILDGLYNGAQIDALTAAQISQWAENNYMGKPCGLMDQTASASGGLVNIDFGDSPPRVTKLDFDFAAHDYALAVVATGTSHDDLTREYAAIPAEMRAVAGELGGETLRDVAPDVVMDSIPVLRQRVGDRALLRALHYLDENQRVSKMVSALRGGDVRAFFRLIIESGESSWKLLQNVYVAGNRDQSIAVALELTRRMLGENGAWRIHGGGFAGTILVFVPMSILNEYTDRMNRIFGRNACKALGIRLYGAMEVPVD